MNGFKSFILGLALLAGLAFSDGASAQTVRVDVSNGHGSGVYVGNGYFLTAAHVVDKETAVKLFYRNNSSFTAQVVWTNFKYDFSLLKSDFEVKFPALNLDCRKPKLGERVFSAGYPMNLGYVYTEGFIAAEEQSSTDWAAYNLMVMQGAPGVSGSPVITQDADVIGLFVGGYPSTTYSVLNPVYPVCDLIKSTING